MNIVSSDNKMLYLNTGLKEAAFSKTAGILNFADKGVLVRFNLFDNNFQFSDWSFSGTNVKDDFVFFEGEAFEGQVAADILNSQNNDKIARISLALNKVYSKAISSNIFIPVNGMGGIFYNEKISRKNNQILNIEILFLPENLFDFAISNFDEKTRAINQGLWQNKSLESNNAHIFTQSVLSYFALTNIMPFMKTDDSARQEDIIDSNFIKIDHLMSNINQTLALSINMGFNIDNKYERDKSLIDLSLLQLELGLKDDGTVSKTKEQITLSQEEFEKKVKQEKRAVEETAAKKRFIKRNSITILAVLAAFAIISIFAFNRYSSSLEKPCAKNLNCIDAIQVFYSGFHTQNSQIMSIVAKGTDAKNTCNMISNVYVSGQTRTAYEGKNANLSPELYLTRPELIEHWVFGITDFKIDGNAAFNRFAPITRKDFNNLIKSGATFPVPQVTEENHTVTYNLVYNSGKGTPFIIDSYTVQVNCNYIKDQWYITGLISDYTSQQVEQESFLKEYNESLEQTKNPKETVAILREKYTWLPDDLGMDAGFIEAEYQKNYFK